MTERLTTKIVVVLSLMVWVGTSDVQAQEISIDDGSSMSVPTTDGLDMPKQPKRRKRSKRRRRWRPADLSKLGRLAPFSDIAVISRKYLPRTKRFELSPNVGTILNDSFFNNLVFGGRLAYYFNEKYGVEASGIFFSSNSRSVTDELAVERGIATAGLAVPTSYYGLAFKWVPLYGKMGLLNKTIVPFETYVMAGGGLMGTNQNTQPPAIHLGTGQLYAIKKWLSFRWDFSWYLYSSTSTISGGSSSFFNNLHITIGFSFYLPGAGYR